MRTAFYKSFARDLKKIKEPTVLKRVQAAIEEIEAADTLTDPGALKKLIGAENCFRIRIGRYRIGLVLERDTLAFVRCLPRKDLYRYFP